MPDKDKTKTTQTAPTLVVGRYEVAEHISEYEYELVCGPFYNPDVAATEMAEMLVRNTTRQLVVLAFMTEVPNNAEKI